jgi:hypothetical protein
MAKTQGRYSKADIREAMRVLGAVGGSVKSERKTAAARANAKKPRAARRVGARDERGAA